MEFIELKKRASFSEGWKPCRARKRYLVTSCVTSNAVQGYVIGDRVRQGCGLRFG
jgi:hypothetical protein